jgi:hypothetical protein
MDSAEDAIGTAKPPKPQRVHDPERSKRFLLQVVAVGAVAVAVFSGITAWETHEDRMNSKAFYCTFASDPGNDPAQKQLADQLDC